MKRFLAAAVLAGCVGLVMATPAAAIPYLYKNITGVSGNTTNGATTSIKAIAGSLVEINCDNNATTGRVLQIFNSIASVMGTAKPLLEYPIGAASSGSVGIDIVYSPPRYLGGSALIIGASTLPQGSATPSDGQVNCNFVYQ